MMKSFLFITLMLTCLTALQAQYGLSAQYVSAKVESSVVAGTQTVNAQGFSAGLNYWLRLRNVRIEFFPELAYGLLETKQIESLPDLSVQNWSFTIPASFYLLELKGDCQCPTFSKQNDLLKKGLFVQLIGAYQNERSKTATTQHTDWQQNLAAGIGTGLDIGLSDFITLTPLVQYLHTVYSSKAPESPGTESAIRAGIRLTFRPDYR
ncbi:MAG: hypothetical protein IPL46_06735 [Saprospiraceae bacterium]|nr:hypothetical protein [Saprospiraceae bacterium]